jgi:hypothetical protein
VTGLNGVTAERGVVMARTEIGYVLVDDVFPLNICA